MKKQLILFSLACLILLCSFAQAADRVVVIPLNTSSPVYVAGTEITSLPATISSSGFYFITKNLTCPTGDHGISISANDVTLDLMGFTLLGPDGTGDYDGIYMSTGSDNIEIRNGTVKNFLRAGIRGSSGNQGIRIKNISAQQNGREGILLTGGLGSTIQHCTVNNNGDLGINGGALALVTDNVSFYNAGDGIFAGASSVVRGNACYNNGGDGIETLTASTLIGNTSYGNDEYGFKLATKTLADQNTAVSNTLGDTTGCSPCSFGINQWL
ncbi:MAG: right-handed parallel beta-helix repeat-containing protein [Pseudomonadota bacterium]